MATAKKNPAYPGQKAPAKPPRKVRQVAPVVEVHGTVDDTFIALQHFHRDLLRFTDAFVNYPKHFSATDDVDLMSACVGL
jgi:hypothetical protein